MKDGSSLGIGGFITAAKPMALLRAIARRGVKDLTIFAPPSSYDVDLLIGLGMVKAVSTPYVGLEAVAPIGPFFSRRAAEGVLEVLEVDLGLVLAQLKAKIQELPFMPVRGPVGTSIPDLNPTLKWIDDPFGGPPLIAAPPIHLDVVYLHAAQADVYGNVQHLGAQFADILLAQAADTVVVEVERIVPNEIVRRAPTETTIPCEFVDMVVHAPYGAHPLSFEGFYRLDEEHLRHYVQVARSALDGDPAPFREYVETFIYGPATHGQYLERVGLDRIFSLTVE